MLTVQGEIRRGATLLELVVALLLAGVVAAAVARSRHGTGGSGARDVADAAARRQLRAAAAALPVALRAIAPGDVRAMQDTALDLRATLGGGIVCATDVAAAVVVVATELPGAGWAAPPHDGDTLLVLAPVTSDTGGDDAWRWRALRVAGDATPAQAPCLTSPVAAVVRVPVAAADLAIGPSIGALLPGAATRLVRRARWSVYRAGDGRWYLGYREAVGAGLAGVQPVSGPHDVVDGGGVRRPGVRFTYRARDGGAAAVPSAVARVDVVVRAEGSRDSLALAVLSRNAP